ncbi:MAG: phage portal protein [Pseudomonadota bacterium]
MPKDTPRGPGGVAVAIEPGVVARLVQGVRFVFSGKSGAEFFGPGTPLPPVAPEAAGRQFDYPFGFNTNTQPRQTESVSFAQMRALADSYDLLRLVIETRKDQLCAQAWTIRPKDEKAERTPQCDEIEAFLQCPDQEHDWDTWLRMLLEDLFVLDAPTIYPRMTRGNGLYALELVDGATIKRVLDATGRTPLPPDPAYQQVIKGLPAVNYTREELIYAPRNPRTNRIYGYSPVEQVIMTVNLALRRQLHQLNYYTEGTIPDAMIGVPENWQPEQIRQFQEWWDTVMEGDQAKRRKAIFVPGGMDPTFTKEAVLKDEMDEWLARVICFCFSISPQPFIKEMNRASAQTNQEAAKEEGLLPLMQWVEGRMNGVLLRFFGAQDLQFTWLEEDDTDPKTQAEISKIYVDAKVLHPDEIRADLGREPLTAAQKADLTPPVPTGPDGKPLKPGAPDAADDDSTEKRGKKKSLSGSTAIARRLQSRAAHSLRY